MAIGGGKREKKIRKKVGDAGGAIGAIKNKVKKGKTTTGVGGIGTRAAGPGKYVPTPAEKRQQARARANRASKGHSRTGSTAKQEAKVKSDARARAAARAKPKTSPSARNKQVGKVASKVAARSGKTKQQSRSAARRIIAKRKNK
jgi:hypothetical protein